MNKSSDSNQVIVGTIDRYEDDRGYVAIPFDQELCTKLGIEFDLKQINQGFSKQANTLRGLHFQLGANAQAKLVSCLQGSIYSVAVNIDPHSEDYLKSKSAILTKGNRNFMYVPKGYAHGYVSLEDNTLMQWLVDEDFAPAQAYALNYRDHLLGIEWPVELDEVIVSPKDAAGLTLKQYEQLLKENL